MFFSHRTKCKERTKEKEIKRKKIENKYWISQNVNNFFIVYQSFKIIFSHNHNHSQSFLMKTAEFTSPPLYTSICLPFKRYMYVPPSPSWRLVDGA
jgi:hypothetical protein